MNTDYKAKTVGELKTALEKIIETLGPDALWCPYDEESIVIAVNLPKPAFGEIWMTVSS